MLVNLSISNFAIIRHLELTLQPGLNILSGETGAGKSIIINAMNLILGGRASADLIRSGCDEARVEALFSFPDNRALFGILEEMECPFEGELLIKRRISREGRNRVLINGSMATIQMLSRLGSMLISISGQHEHQLLLKPDNHLFLLDDFGGLTLERRALNEAFSRYQTARDEIESLRAEMSSAEEKRELARFQVREIEEADITPGEDEALQEEKRRLQYAETLLETVTQGYDALYERSDSVLSSVAGCIRRLDRGVEIDRALKPVRDSLYEIQVKLEDAAYALRDYQNRIHMDPRRLEQVADRLELLNGLKRKYGKTIEDILLYRDKTASLVVDMEQKKHRLDELQEEERAAGVRLLDSAAALSEKRKRAAAGLEKAMEKELRHLHMVETRFRVLFHDHMGEQGGSGKKELQEMRADGIDRVEFMISPNVGEELRPLSRIASGGELSRIMLAAKTILARTASVETIIFDEVDSGISGATAEVVGNKLLALSEFHQTLCITHLPQIATRGTTHFRVSKEVVEGRTETHISILEPEDRVREIARLLAGQEITPRAMAHAREMLH
jgi:DNA repair protein RecN (Recombination protein N)